VRHVVVLRHLAAPHDWTQGRDHWWTSCTAGAPEAVADVATEAMSADDPFLLMFTSGHQRQAERASCTRTAAFRI
jgi:acetyl-CoA synthetase